MSWEVRARKEIANIHQGAGVLPSFDRSVSKIPFPLTPEIEDFMKPDCFECPLFQHALCSEGIPGTEIGQALIWDDMSRRPNSSSRFLEVQKDK